MMYFGWICGWRKQLFWGKKVLSSYFYTRRETTKPGATRLVLVNPEQLFLVCSVSPRHVFAMRKVLKTPNGKIKMKEAGVTLLALGRARSCVQDPAPAVFHLRAPWRRMPVLPGGNGMLVRHSVRSPKSSGVVALAPDFPTHLPPWIAWSCKSSSALIC